MAGEIELFLEMMASEASASTNTLCSYENDLRQFFEFCSSDCQNLKTSDISEYIDFLNKRHYAVKTQARKLSTLRSFCKFLMEEKILKDNPLFEINMPKRERDLPKVLSENQIDTLLKKTKFTKSITKRRIGIIAALMFASGMRVSEAVSLPLSALNFNKNQIVVKGKGAKERIVFMDEETKKNLENYICEDRSFFIAKNKDSKYLFPSKRAVDGHITRDAFFKGLKELGIECDMNVRFIFPHALRHSFATNLLDHDVDLRSVQKMLGHENIATTEIYTHIAPTKLIERVISMHPLQNFENNEGKK